VWKGGEKRGGGNNSFELSQHQGCGKEGGGERGSWKQGWKGGKGKRGGGSGCAKKKGGGRMKEEGARMTAFCELRCFYRGKGRPGKGKKTPEKGGGCVKGKKGEERHSLFLRLRNRKKRMGRWEGKKRGGKGCRRAS